MLSAILSFLDSPLVGAAFKILSVGLLVAVIFLGVRMAGADARLAQARRQTAEVAIERDQALAALVLSQDDVSRLKQGVMDLNESIALSKSAAERRMAETQKAVARAESIGAREARIKALLAIDPHAGESRCDAATRLINDALKDLKS